MKQADILAARHAEILAVKQAGDTVTTKSEQILVVQAAEVVTYKNLLNSEATSDRDSVSRDSGQTGSLEEGKYFLMKILDNGNAVQENIIITIYWQSCYLFINVLINVLTRLFDDLNVVNAYLSVVKLAVNCVQ